ncbi:MAG: HAMP domain-containing sensor histidine kinase [Cyanobacteriota bacterium]
MNIFLLLRKLDVRSYLIVAFLLTSIIPIFVLSWIEHQYITEQIILSIKKENNLLLDDISERLKDYIQKEKEILGLTYNNIVDLKDKNKIQDEIYKISYISEDINSIQYYRYGDNIFTSKNKNIKKTTDLYNEEIIEKLEQKKNIIFDTIIENELLKTTIPFLDEDNNVEGYISISFNLNRVFNYFKKALDKKDKIYVYDKNKNKLVFPSKKDVKNEKTFKLLLSGNSKYDDYDFFIVGTFNWAIILEHSVSLYDQEKLQKNADNTFNILVTSLLIATSMGLLISYYQYNFIKKFLDSISEVSKGNYKEKLEINFFLIPKEFIDLIDEFNKMVQQVRITDTFKSNLIDTVSHEFRTPLTSIKGFSSTLLRKDSKFDEETTRKFLKIISTQSDRLSRMIEDLLVVPKLEGNFLKINITEINLENSILEVAEFFQDIEIKIEVAEKYYIKADSDRFQQILINLFENAKKYSDPKGNPIKISAEKKENFAFITIANSSNKISDDKVRTLFDKFMRLDDTLTRTTRGAGLGLYITKSLVELMGGEIFIESYETEFRIIFSIPLSEDMDDDFY